MFMPIPLETVQFLKPMYSLPLSLIHTTMLTLICCRSLYTGSLCFWFFEYSPHTYSHIVDYDYKTGLGFSATYRILA